ncbi:hypothetical protein [Actinomadura nitritigenes]|uniref:Uncharacterized protein n=1 Tax=Actinomadura nitritigenes TaxID=134602 RepID=A0ABS3RGB6_9ACTN|nr:hypothetical protein [Actinomadura nitritigenes]MBO2445275.1 hypothetical protein [Actinomadura nitritigenes]
MSARRPTARIDVTVDLTTEPIQGVLRHRHGADKPFTGWTALVRAVELALDDERRHRALGGQGDPHHA